MDMSFPAGTARIEEGDGSRGDGLESVDDLSQGKGCICGGVLVMKLFTEMSDCWSS